MARGQGAPGGRSPPPTRRLTLVVHHLEQARAGLAVEAELGLTLALASAAGAAAFVGVGFLVALGRLAGRPVLIDCGDEPGTVLAALRAGATRIRFTGPPEVRGRLFDAARQRHAELVRDLPMPAVVLAPDDDAARRLRALFAEPDARTLHPRREGL